MACISAAAATRRPHALAEGIATASVARDLARHHAISTPIIDAVAAIVERALTVNEAIERLMNRPLRREAD